MQMSAHTLMHGNTVNYGLYAIIDRITEWQQQYKRTMNTFSFYLFHFIRIAKIAGKMDFNDKERKRVRFAHVHQQQS